MRELQNKSRGKDSTQKRDMKRTCEKANKRRMAEWLQLQSLWLTYKDKIKNKINAQQNTANKQKQKIPKHANEWRSSEQENILGKMKNQETRRQSPAAKLYVARLQRILRCERNRRSVSQEKVSTIDIRGIETNIWKDCKQLVALLTFKISKNRIMKRGNRDKYIVSKQKKTWEKRHRQQIDEGLTFHFHSKSDTRTIHHSDIIQVRRLHRMFNANGRRLLERRGNTEWKILLHEEYLFNESGRTDCPTNFKSYQS